MKELLKPITSTKELYVRVLKENKDGTKVITTASPAFAVGLLNAMPYTIKDTEDEFDIIVENSLFSFSTQDFVLKPKSQNKKAKTNGSKDED